MDSREIDWPSLWEAACAVRQRAYAPYSKFFVGAAVLTKTGRVFTGCNVENASYGLSLCAERNAIAHAVAEGDTELIAVAVAASPLALPCGACRQVIAEFGLRIKIGCIDAAARDHVAFWEICELLPDSFRMPQASALELSE